MSADLTQLPLEELLEQIQDNLYGGNAEPVVAGVHELLRRGLTPYDTLTQGLIAGMDVVGEDFRTGDGTQAWVAQADLVVHPNDAARAEHLIHSTIQERKRLYLPLHDARKRIENS